MSDLLLLIYEFTKIGLFAVGGGLASLPFLYQIADKYDWFDRAMLADMIAISESTPGPIGVNMATYAGFTTSGIIGGILATIAVVFPSFIIVMLVSKVLNKFKDAPLVQAIFYGLRPAVTALIAAACLGVARIALLHPVDFTSFADIWHIFNLQALAMCGILWFLLQKYKKHPAFYIIGAAVVGMMIKM